MGMPKTGTTAIQNFCGDNIEFLADNNISYPIMEGNGEYFNSHYTDAGNAYHLMAGKESVEKETKRVISIVNSQKEDNIIFSTEFFWEWVSKSDHQLQIIRKLMDAGMEIHVVVYLRRQVEWVELAWMQNVKYLNECRSLRDYMYHPDMCDQYLNVGNILDRLEAVVGSEQMHVRVYERGQLDGGDAVIDFFKNVFNLDVGDVYRNEDINSSVDIRSGLIKKIINQTGYSADILRETFYTAIKNNTQYDISRYGKEKTSLLSQEEMMRYMDRYRDSNRKVAEKYFHREELFFEPYRRSGQDDGVMLEDVIFVFASAMAQLYENVLRIEQYRETVLQNYIRGGLTRLVYHVAKAEKPVYIYGCGDAGKALMSMLDGGKYLDIVGFTESADPEEPKMCMGVPVIPYDKIKSKKDYMFIIATVTETYKEEIKLKLQEDDIYDYYVL